MEQVMEQEQPWRTRLAAAVEERGAAQKDADEALIELYDTMLEAFESGEMTYRQIAEATGLSRIRVGQVLKLMRERRLRGTA